MNSVKTENLIGFQKVVWENVNETLAGGASVELNGFTNPDGVIPAGTIVSVKDKGTGTHKLVPDASALPAEGVIGITTQTVAIDDIPLVSVGIGGAVRVAALSANYQTNIAAIRAAFPKITFID